MNGRDIKGIWTNQFDQSCFFFNPGISTEKKLCAFTNINSNTYAKISNASTFEELLNWQSSNKRYCRFSYFGRDKKWKRTRGIGRLSNAKFLREKYNWLPWKLFRSGLEKKLKISSGFAKSGNTGWYSRREWSLQTLTGPLINEDKCF